MHPPATPSPGLPELLVREVLARPRSTLSICLVVTLVLGSGLLQLEIRTDGAAIHPSRDATVQHTEADRARFGEPEQAILLFVARPGHPGLRSRMGLVELRRLHDSLRRIPAVDPVRLRSLASLPDPQPFRPISRTPDFLDELPASEDAFERLLQRIDAFPAMHGLFLSPDGRAAAVYVPTRGALDRDAFVAALEDWIAQQRDSSLEIHLTGPLPAEVMLGRAVLTDLVRFVPLMVVVIAALLYLCLGTPGGVLLALVEVLMVLIWTLGLMGHAGVPITLVTTILPVLLMTMAVSDEIHLIERVQGRLADPSAEGDWTSRLRRALHGGLADVGWPIVLTSLTTSIGLLSFSSASMAPVRHFGLFAAAGILLAMLLTFTLVPALALLLPSGWLRPRRAGSPSLRWHERFLLRNASVAACVCGLLVVLCLPGISRLVVQDSWVDNFDAESDIVAAERVFNDRFWGSYRFDVVLRSDGGRRLFVRPEGLQILEEVRTLARSGPWVGGVVTPLIPLEVIGRTLAEEGEIPLAEGQPISELPQQNIARIVFLARSITDRTDIDRFLTFEADRARVRLFVPSSDYERGRALATYLDSQLPGLLERWPEWEVDYHFSGDLPVAVRVVRSVVGNQLWSVLWTLIGIAALLRISLGNGLAACVAMAPVTAALATMLGVMGYAGATLGIATSMFTALSVGVGIDFALHVIYGYRRERSRAASHDEAVRATLETAGRGIRWSAGVLAGGFAVLVASALKPNHSLGLLLAAAMGVSYLTTLALLPRLLDRRWEVPTWIRFPGA